MGEPGGQPLVTAEPSALVAYLPRVTLDWLAADPEARWRSLDGTMAFVDISGFTRMSERLAPRGNLGAEEVNDVMSTTFARLLGVAYENGGSLLKLGGDAMLLFFEGEDHAARACSATWGMRDSLRALGPLDTSAGPVELQMHVGIHTGTFDFFLVGSRHRELIVTGPQAARTVEMEEAASAGEIAVSAATMELLDLVHLGEPRGPGALLASPPRVALTGIPLVPESSHLDILSCIPEALRNHLVTEKLESEHRHATVGFVRFGGVERLREAEGPAAVGEAVAEVVDAAQVACANHGVCFLETDIDGEGGRIVLVAGVPTTAGDDEERLLRTVRAIAEAHTRLPLHIGVATGNVFVGRVGPRYRRAYTILGGTAALAARLMAKAEAGAIWTTPDVVSRSRTTFETSAVGALTLKGKAAPVEVVAVGPVSGSQLATPRKKLPLVDRQRELPVLDAALVPVRMGFGSFVELIGDPGIGKSRIVEELCDRAEGLTVVSAACEQYEVTTPYFAFRKLLSSLVDVSVDGDLETTTRVLSDRLHAIDPELAPWLPLVADVLDVPVLPTQQTDELQPAFRRARLNGVVESLLDNLLEPPTLLLFEDVHWMDEASSDLLRHLGSRLGSKSWLICSTRRPVAGGFVAAEGSPPVPALSLRLDPLPEADASALAAAAAADSELPDEELAAITERAGGNPLFVQELVAARRNGEQQLDVLPETVQGVVTTRIDSLSLADRTLLRWASVLGPSFSGEFVARVLEGDPEAALDSESWERLVEFVERDPYEVGVFRFRHALIRDAAYEGLSFRRRRELHARVADVLAETGDLEEIAETLSLHFSLGERPSETWIYSLLAAGRAKSKFANADAAEFYRRALDASRSLPSLARSELANAWEALGDVLLLSGEYGETRLAYKNARAALRGDKGAIARLCLKEGRLRESEGHYSEALRWFTRGLHAAESLAGGERNVHRLRLSLGYAAARFRQGAMRDCAKWCEQIVLDAQAAGALEELAHAYYLLHLAYTSLGSPERARVRDLALPTYEELGDLLGQANALNNLGIDAYYEGRWEEALAYYERSRNARERIGDVIGAATIANNIAEIYSDQGRLAEAEALLEDVRETCDLAGSRLMAAVAGANLGRAAARGGRPDEARELLAAALAAFREIGAGSFIFETHVRLAEAAAFAGDGEQALVAAAAAEELEETPTPSVEALLYRVRAIAHALRGESAEAESDLDRSLEIARGCDAVYEVALSLRTRARLRGDDALAREAEGLLAGLDVVAAPDPGL